MVERLIVSLAEPRRMGRLHHQSGGRREVFSFEYDLEWLASPDALALDPGLALVSGPQYPPVDRANFGIFLDSAPDRWGRVLMQRRENTRARTQQRRARTLTEWDYLLGVHDATRMGAHYGRTPTCVRVGHDGDATPRR